MMEVTQAKEIIKQTVIDYQRSTNTKKYLDKKAYHFYSGALTYCSADQIGNIKNLILSELNKSSEERNFYKRKKADTNYSSYDSDMPWNN